MGTEAKAAGVHVQLGPVADGTGKIPTAGRAWEAFSPDPYLSGMAMASTINGMQAGGVQACAKHFIGFEQQLHCNTISSNIDDRTNHELYMWPFADAVKSGVTSVMCSYNKVNGTHSCENDQVLQGLLKTEVDFQGYVMSDWGAQHKTNESANAGMDMSMDNQGSKHWGTNLKSAISRFVFGGVAQSRLDDMVTRVLAGWYFVGQDQGSYPTWPRDIPNMPEHKTLARNMARDGIVLLKNDNNFLPLNPTKRLAIIGSDAENPVIMGGGSGSISNPPTVKPITALRETNTVVAESLNDKPQEGLAMAASNKADTAVVFISSWSGEWEGGEKSCDRQSLDPKRNSPPGSQCSDPRGSDYDGNKLVEAVCKAGKPTVVVIHSVGPIILETIETCPHVVAIVWAGLPGSECGNALVDVLFGHTSPSGRLPYTIAKNEGDYGTKIVTGDSDPFTEGLYVDYRHFENKGVISRYAFGHGLCTFQSLPRCRVRTDALQAYTNFSYSNLATSFTKNTADHATVVPGGLANLYDNVATVTAKIKNTGKVAGAEVAQLYIGLPSSAPPTPAKQLRGFQKLNLKSGEEGTATFKLRQKDLSYWDVGSQKWVMPNGKFNVYVGASSQDIRLNGTISAL
ncbi:beta-glucosidase [Purpureocillium lilacinum]|uniref:beta-glucosidase n=1 Tax=Purpureocillium lilacinum TaxID=33203 RepID=A0A179F7I1_PURLI|nr:beta-glucosidase [Purpureocillium lilacinum]OAQ61290.1 beta-glucosidase [Purpureocillium lilacinum]